MNKLKDFFLKVKVLHANGFFYSFLGAFTVLSISGINIKSGFDHYKKLQK